MINLLSALFIRLKKSKVFWLGMLVMCGFGILTILVAYFDMQTSQNIYSLEERLFWYTIIIGVVLAVFCSLFLGSEYADRTLHNKLIVGHTRTGLYLSYLIICAVAGLFMCLASLIPAIILGTLLLGFFQIHLQMILLIILCTFAMTLSYVSIFTLIALINQYKVTSAVISILLAFGFFFVSSYIDNRLNEPQFYPYAVVNEQGEFETDEVIPNNSYLEGTHRVIYEVMNDFLPANQAIQLLQMKTNHALLMVIYDGIIILVTTVLGIIIFKRKDLK